MNIPDGMIEVDDIDKYAPHEVTVLQRKPRRANERSDQDV